jgi:membrane protein required for colicin V production
MAWIDYLIIAVLILSAGLGFWRGLVKEALALATWLAAVWLAWRFAWIVEGLLGAWQAPTEVQLWASRGLVFVIVLIAGAVVAWLMKNLMKHSGLSGTDRLLGTVFGAARGVVLIGVATIALEYLGLAENDWWQASQFAPYSDEVAEGLKRYASLGSDYVKSQAGDG